MSTPFLGEIRLFAGNFAPVNWHLCDGTLLSIAQNSALFQLIGTFYGGDGVSTFQLPDLRGRAPLHNSASLPIGEILGEEQVSLTQAQIPAHTHPLMASQNAANAAYGPAGNVLAATATPLYASGVALAMSAAGTANSGGNLPHDNMAPYLAVNYIIATAGIFPSRA